MDTLYEANLHDVNLYKANLRGANLFRANLHNANLSKANLSGANLHGADLFGCTGIVVFGPIGNSKRLGYIVTSETSVNVKLGCFWGPLDAAITAIQGKYGKNSSYQACVEAMANLLLNK